MSDEENAVRYASGYLVKVLKNQYEKKKGMKGTIYGMSHELMSMSAREESHNFSTCYEYTTVNVFNICA